MRVILWGTYDLGKPRTRIMRAGLQMAGVEVIEVHDDIWHGNEDKSQIGRLAQVWLLLRWLAAYPRLIARYLTAPRHDAVVVPYLGQLDILVLWPFARLRGRPIVWDMFLSLYDTVTIDRKLLQPEGIVGQLLKVLEWCSCRAADLVLMDTAAHARYAERLLSLPAGKIEAIPVGVETDSFPRLTKISGHEGPVRILFYGQLIPLHGVRTILEAALSEAGRAYQWQIIGTGQEHALVCAALAKAESDHVRWEEWVDYASLADRIAAADICLGIFGASEKAASVVPNKVYQALAAGRSVITRDSAAMRELFPAPEAGLRLIPHSSPQALLRAVAELAAEGCPALPRERLVGITPPEIGHKLRAKIASLIRGRKPADEAEHEK